MLVAGLLALGALAPALLPRAAADSLPGTVRADGVPAVEATLPSVFATPWSARAGYSPEYLSEVSDPSAASGNVTVHLTLYPSNAGLFAPPASGSAPMSLGEIAAEYGLPPAPYDTLASYFEDEGLSILHRDPLRLSMTVEGPATSVGAAFDTALLSGTFNGTVVRFPSSAPSLPSPFEAEVSAVSGLSDGFDRFSMPLEGVGPVPSTPATPTPARTTDAITPSALHLAYGLNDLYNFSGSPHYASGEAIAVLLWGDGFDPSDLQTFFSTLYPSGFPQLNISWYPVDQDSPPSAAALQDPSHAPQELTLDLEYSGSSAPGASLDAVYAPDGPESRGYSPSDATMEDALTQAIELPHVVTLSMSFGTPDHSDPSFQAAFETGFAAASHRGITILAASGDNGDSTASTGGVCPTGGEPVQYPAASPQVLAVGGAAPTLSESVFGTVTGLASETAWNGSGGGFSPSYGIPSWQSNSSASSTIDAGGHRGIADVAGPATYERFYYAGALMAGNGTSFATPFWAGLVTEMDALLPRPLGFLDPTLYDIASQETTGTKAEGLVDVQGDSGPSCVSVGSGWDPATGWGTPRAGILFDDLIGTLVDLNLTAGPANVAPGGVVSVSVTVTNASSHAPIAALPLTVSLLAPAGYLGPCGSGMGSVSTTTDGFGNASAALTVPACYLGSSVVVSVTIASEGYFGSTSQTLRVNLIGLAGFLSLAQDYPDNVAVFGAIMGAAIVIGLLVGRYRRRRRLRRAAASAPAVAGAVPPPPPPSGAGSPPFLAPAPEPAAPPGTGPPTPVEEPSSPPMPPGAGP